MGRHARGRLGPAGRRELVRLMLGYSRCELSRPSARRLTSSGSLRLPCSGASPSVMQTSLVRRCRTVGGQAPRVPMTPAEGGFCRPAGPSRG